MPQRDADDRSEVIADEVRPLLSAGSYRRLRRSVVAATMAVSLLPLLVMSLVNYYQYSRSYREITLQPIAWLTLNAKRSLELFLAERQSALTFIINDRTFAELSNHERLAQTIANMNRSLSVGPLADLGLINSRGDQLCYVGAHHLEGRNYAEQDWFDKVSRRGPYVSDVFLGYRNSPHFAVATRHELPSHDFYILRATIDAEMLSEQILPAGLSPSDDVFLVNRQGVLQTPSRRYGKVLERIPLPVPPFSPGVQVIEQEDEHGDRVFVAYSYIENSPFVLMFIKPMKSMAGMWLSLRSELIVFLAISSALIVGVVLWGSGLFIDNLRRENRRRAILMHQIEYTNKLASIGRLAAGVAHEINNPLAIINEKAGLLKDIVSMDTSMPKREKLLSLVESILSSVDRCSAVTHRLLGFAKRMDLRSETIDLEHLVREVLGFLGREAEYRNITIAVDSLPELPTIESDRGQLQQVFLNLLNNALAAVSDGGRIDIVLRPQGPDWVSVVVADNGCGIPKENLKRIFEPFFTTKQGWGTGLGLSITYGIVEKLGGRIEVDSEVGKGTRFTVVLPRGRKG